MFAFGNNILFGFIRYSVYYVKMFHNQIFDVYTIRIYKRH